MNEPQVLEEWRKLHGPRITSKTVAEEVPEVLEYEPSPVMTGQETPKIVERLGIQNQFQVDPEIKTKAVAVEEFILGRIEEEQLRDSQVSYDTIFNRFTGKLPSFEESMRRQEGLTILDLIFQEAAIGQKMSSRTYLKNFEEEMKYEKVRSLLGKLSEALKAII